MVWTHIRAWELGWSTWTGTISLVVVVTLVIAGIRKIDESERGVMERFGKNRLGIQYDTEGNIKEENPGHPYILRPGLNFTIPLVDQLRIKQNIQERTLKIEGPLKQKIQAAGVIWEVESVLYYKIGHIVGYRKGNKGAIVETLPPINYEEAEPQTGEEMWVPVVEVNDEDVHQATYGFNPGKFDPHDGVQDLAISTLRDIIGVIGSRSVKKDSEGSSEITAVERLENSQDEINLRIRDEMNQATRNWGIVIMRHEITELLPPENIRKQLQAKIEAQKQKEAEIIRSEGERDSRINKAEGEKQERIKLAEAKEQEQKLDAEGEAVRLERLAEAAEKPGAEQAFAFQIAEEAIDAIKSLGEKGNATIIAPGGLAEMASAAAVGLKTYLGRQSRDTSTTTPPSGQSSSSKEKKS